MFTKREREIESRCCPDLSRGLLWRLFKEGTISYTKERYVLVYIYTVLVCSTYFYCSSTYVLSWS
jgi:hypothetical protein